MIKKALLLFVLATCAAYSAVNFPYPQEQNYGNETINATSANASADLKKTFESFITGFYETGTCNGKLSNVPCARIKWDTPAQTVSEGIAYGMLMMVYFSDAAKSYQDNFDRLWAYYQNFTNNNLLMNWKINGFTGVANDGRNAASDAEFDAALALAMAHYQFGTGGGKNYLDSAKALIARIRQYEIDPNNLHRPGDGWNSERNPSYVSPATFEIFREVESAQASKWESVIDANYTLLTRNQNSTSGLFSDWCKDDGSHSRGDYGYDAARTPWRLAWAYAWYGHSTAKTLLENLYTKFLNNKNASDIGGTISLTGSMNNHKNATFLGPFTNALSYNSANQTKMNSFWTQLMSFENQSYYNHSLQILTGLLASGNMPNLKALSEVPSSSSVLSSSSSEPSSSSSSSNTTHIALSKIANANVAQIVSNGISLQVVNNASLEIFDLRGKSVRKLNFASGSWLVSLSDLPKNLYIISVSFDNSKEILRVPVR
ncbi:MAG: glycosyl hydrolase family 8 [Fibromonadales bacterium]|nr:glycosyl hydrolase family 8 [Fibromonadales bacterium]